MSCDGPWRLADVTSSSRYVDENEKPNDALFSAHAGIENGALGMEVMMNIAPSNSSETATIQQAQPPFG